MPGTKILLNPTVSRNRMCGPWTEDKMINRSRHDKGFAEGGEVVVLPSGYLFEDLTRPEEPRVLHSPREAR